MAKLTRRYCMGFWPVAGNPKRSAAHYDALLPRTLRMIVGGRLHLWHDSSPFRDKVARLCHDLSIHLTDEIVALDDLPGRDAVRPILETCARVHSAGGLKLAPRDKESKHFARYVQEPQAVHDLLTIWASKVPLVANLVGSSSDYEHTCWIDASISKFCGRRSGWNFPKIKLPNHRVSHYGSPMFFRGCPLPLNASFLGSDAPTWPRLNALFNEQLEIAAAETAIHDEETVLAKVVAKEPDLFYRIGVPLRGARSLPARLGSLVSQVGNIPRC